MLYRSGSDLLHRLRVIADGRIHGAEEKTSDHYSGDAGLFHMWNDSRFGPPCPPVLPRLGYLETV
ncbi:MAG: hypothetical protein HKP58_15160 [Desulfatitalea sp.]|nr:hypothetical protein [Desulfatitalea sp.]